MIIVYCADRNLYPILPTALNSLLIHNEPYIEKIYILLEDDSLDTIKHPKVEFINFLKHDCIKDNFNCTSLFPYMAMARCYLTKILTEPKVLYLDVDTVVEGSLKELWNTTMGSNCIMGMEECDGYINSGVLLMNLHLIKALKEDDNLIRLMKICRMQFPDQDAINIVFHNSKGFIPQIYNKTGFAKQAYSDPDGYIIRHFAGIAKPWKPYANPKDIELWDKYKTDRIDWKGVNCNGQKESFYS